VVYDTAATMTISAGKAMLRHGGVLLDLNPNPVKFIRAVFDRGLEIIVCSPRTDILEKLGDAAHEGKFSIPIGETVSLGGAISLIAELEKGRRLGGKGVVAME
jgi:NADPH:quinone reductase-like Zn-dependent oxidoreductase